MIGEGEAGGAPAGGESSDGGGAASEGDNQTPDTGGATDTDTGGEGAQGGEGTTPEFSVPEEYAENKWANDIKSQDDLWKQLANSQELIGKKQITPIDYETASEEDVAKYHSSIVPESPDAYKFSDDADQEFSKALIPGLQKAGIHPAQLAIIEPILNEVASDLVGKQYAVDRSEEGYFELTEKAFGENHKEVVAQIENTYKEHLSDETKAFLDNASNAERFAFDQTVKAIMDAKDAEIAKIKEEYGVEETGAQGEGEAATQKTSVEDEISKKREEIKELEAKVGNKDWNAITKAKNELQELYKKKVKLQKGK